MRLLVYQLRPLALQEAGLIGALQQRLDAVEKRAGVRARLEVTGALPASGAWEEAFYRIAQEALNNALKHAAATATIVSVHAYSAEGVDTQVELNVYDNGRGFDADNENGGGMGLLTMRERAADLGAAIKIRSLPDHGTTVTMRAAIGEVSQADLPVLREGS